MYYLHQIKTPRDTMIEISESPEPRPGHIEINGHPLVYQDGSTVPNRVGWTLGPVAERTEAERLAAIIAQSYNWDIMVDGEPLGLPYSNSNAAVALGRRGGSVTSERKAAASAANGRKGGRPRKTV